MKSSCGVPVLVTLLSGVVVACGPLPEEASGAVEAAPPVLESQAPVDTVTEAGLVPTSGWEVCDDAPLRVGDINPGPASSSPSELVSAGGRLFFSATEPMHGRELWTSDGPGRPASLVRDVNPRGDSAPRSLTVMGRWVYFVADDGAHGAELWRTDGTEKGTELVRDVRPGPEGSVPEQLTVVGGTLYFTAYEESHGRELWRTDGTTWGTWLVRDFVPGAEPSASSQLGLGKLTAWDGGLALTVSRWDTYAVVLWRVDARGQAFPLYTLDYGLFIELKAAGRQLFFTVNPGTDVADLWVTQQAPGTAEWLRRFPGEEPNSLTALGDSVYFAAGGEDWWGDSGDPLHGSELWTSDGTVAGTRLVRDIRPGSASAFVPGESPFFTVWGGTLYFAADDGEHGRELWRTDGTQAGTWLVRDVEPGQGGSEPRNLSAQNGTLFFSAATAGHGREPWYSGGRAWNTQPLADVAPGEASSSPGDFVRSGFDVFFTATDGAGDRELYSVPFRPALTCGLRVF